MNQARYIALLALHRLMLALVDLGTAAILLLGALDAYVSAVFGTRRVSTMARQFAALIKEHR
ncbi:hypothetical protein Aph01nite_34290 [Acrocarpospora phusangensis]|uniref:Uncharacterized protein n=1 Tax=Acrocarpospora phusangensis TaxID=1070424 RepID=A0A919QCD0_9ACTN|nr:hypothetical protein [Acrocarpospora phusangensis]GIH25119.1 hypothetical protein Aph01nite_34290 [Acrocarpospora phusangensis]